MNRKFHFSVLQILVCAIVLLALGAIGGIAVIDYVYKSKTESAFRGGGGEFRGHGATGSWGDDDAPVEDTAKSTEKQ